MRALFPEDMQRQKTMLLGALVLVRKSLRDLDSIVPQASRSRHATRCVRRAAEDYPVVGTALIGAMAAIAGDAWETEYETAWAAAFAIVAATMLEGADAAELEAAA